jgi:hypothetical protein
VAQTENALVGILLDRYGRTYAEEAGIRLADKPSPLYQLLVLTTLLSARISAVIPVRRAVQSTSSTTESAAAPPTFEAEERRSR